MNTRKIIIAVAGVLIIAGSFFLSGALSNGKKSPKRKAEKKEARSVRVIEFKNRSMQANLEVSGQIIAGGKVEIFSEVGGKLLNTGKIFKEGVRFAKGEVIAKIDNEQSRYNLLAQKSALQNTMTQMMPDLKLDFPEAYQKWENYLSNFNVNSPIQVFPEPESEKEKYYVVTKGIYNQYYTIKSQEEMLQKYFIYAPFSGTVTQSSIYPGTVIRVGQKMGEMMSTFNYELDASVSLKDIDYVGIGDRVMLSSEDINGNWEGRIVRISDKIDESTQTVKVFISVSGNRLREGMFLKGEIQIQQVENAFAIPRSLLIDEQYVFLIENNKLKKKPVEIARFNGETAFIKGLKNGQKVLNETLPNAYEGMPIKVLK